MRLTPFRALDSLAGLVLGVAAGLAIVWVLSAAALLQPKNADLRRAVQRSTLLSRLNEAVPPHSILNAVARIDPFEALATAGPAPAPPDPALAQDPVVAEVQGSVLRVTGTACGLGIEGTAWVAGRETVVTAAHVVAGESDTEVATADGSTSLPAHAVVFDPRNDIAVLRVPGLRKPALRIVDPRAGTPAATTPSGRGFVTTAPAPTTVPVPTSFMTTAALPIQAPAPMSIRVTDPS